MTHELIDRYIYAVTRRLPPKLRGDVEQELAGLIADMLEARCGEVLPTDKDIRVVLTELGSPEQLAAKYSGDEGRALIGGEYFALYKMVLKIVLPIAAAGIAFASVLSLFTGGELEGNVWLLIAKTVGGALGGAFGGLLQAFAIITFIFAVFEWKKVKFGDGDFITALPQVPAKDERIKLWEPIAGMVWAVVAAVFFLGFPQAAGFWFGEAGWLPIFDVINIRGFWLPIILWAVLGIAKEIVRLIDGRYTKRLAVAASVANPIIAAAAVIVFRSGSIMNRAFLFNMRLLFEAEAQFITLIFEKFHLFFLGIVIFALVVETVTFWAKALKYKN